MPSGLERFYGSGDLHFITASCYRRRALLDSPWRRDLFLQVLELVRQRYQFVVVAYVVMPEHVHLLISEPERARVSTVIQMLKQNVSRKLRLPEGSPFWEPRYYDFNVWSRAKQIEKLRYIHRNPVRRGLAEKSEDWKWSSFLHYATGVEGVVEIESKWTARKRERAGILVGNEGQNPRPVSPKSGDTRTGHPRE